MAELYRLGVGFAKTLGEAGPDLTFHHFIPRPQYNFTPSSQYGCHDTAPEDRKSKVGGIFN
jgi:hypothetical protein